ncbi:hydrolase, alpha/beta domain protein [Dictyocaulus viviparus]|uniref:Hydrolase, alpha/beta domain protein n=1 Tax=Dictyocaulus viviparus TaxID=29172 RepID=A0A0D8XI86_DICVI|nr:hydrolase, alpha/beta domain protein [Dictyocaulus viviparus]
MLTLTTVLIFGDEVLLMMSTSEVSGLEPLNHGDNFKKLQIVMSCLGCNGRILQCIENCTSTSSGSLFPPLRGNYDKYHEMLRGLEQLDSTCFYGRPLGFQVSGPITLENTSGGKVRIPEPSAHTGPRPSPPYSSNQQPASPYLVFHCHGGGYVATSSKSHETYLRVWAKLLNCTIVSVEYSLAPANPFPRPTEEVLFAYAWIVNHPHLVGWTGEKMCMVGDSAGGNLIMSVNLRLIELDVKKKPDGIVPVYTPFLFQYLPSPSRLLSVMDPLLHMGVVLRCVAAYTGGNINNKKNEEIADHCGHKSLQEYVDQGGSQSIVSLVQNVNDPLQVDSSEAGSLFSEKDEKPIKNEQEDEESIEEDEDARSISSVHIGSDPLHIQLSSTVFDNELLNYLIKHPTTKDSVTMVGGSGDVIEGFEGEINTNTGVTDEKARKRTGIVNNVGGAISSTVPNTPESEPGISNSSSSNNLQNQTSQDVTYSSQLSSHIL